MIFISGFGEGNKKLKYRQEWICKSCHRQGSLELWMTYKYISFFFIPVIKLDKKYYAATPCCDTTYTVDREVIKQLKKGVISTIPDEELKNGYTHVYEKTCGNCGYVSPPDFEFCPKCGRKL